jgi:hypothetical protein
MIPARVTVWLAAAGAMLAAIGAVFLRGQKAGRDAAAADAAKAHQKAEDRGNAAAADAQRDGAAGRMRDGRF